MQTPLLIFLTLCMGAMLSIYLPTNSTVARILGSPITASLPFFLMGFLTTVCLFLFFGDFKTLVKIKNVPFYLYFPGFVAAFMVLGTTFLIPKLGARKYFILMIAGQILMGMIVSHFGVLESPKDPVTTIKLLGALLIVAGAVLATF